MYDVGLIQAAFSKLIGVRQSNIPGLPFLTTPLTDSESGIYVDDKHPLVSTENLYYSCPNFDPNIYPSWASGSNYIAGRKVVDLGIIYNCKVSVINDTDPPASDTVNWEVYNPMQTWILQKYKQACSNLFAEVVKRKKLLHIGKSILERQQLFRGGGSKHEKITPEGRFVGFELLPQQAEGLWVIIDKIGIQVDTVCPDLKWYIYHCDRAEAQNIWDFPVTVVDTFDWQDLKDNGTPPKYNAIMKYLSNNTIGSYFVGYYEDDLAPGARVLSKAWDCSGMPCAGCDGLDIGMYNQWSRYTTMRNISVPSIYLNSDRTLFDTKHIKYDSFTNWGLNMSLTVRCDLTDYIIYSKYLFADAFAMQFCKELLEAIASGIRYGPTPAQTKLSAIAALDEKAPGNWITKEGGYRDSINALDIDMSGFSNSCMSCNDKKSGINFFSI